MQGRSGPFWDGVEAFLAAMLFDTVGPALVATRAPTSSSRPSSSVWAFLRPVRPEVPEHLVPSPYSTGTRPIDSSSTSPARRYCWPVSAPPITVRIGLLQLFHIGSRTGPLPASRLHAAVRNKGAFQ
jgi:hypothetical protein